MPLKSSFFRTSQFQKKIIRFLLFNPEFQVIAPKFYFKVEFEFGKFGVELEGKNNNSNMRLRKPRPKSKIQIRQLPHMGMMVEETDSDNEGTPMEYCCLCSAYFDKPINSSSGQPSFNSLICQILDFEPPQLPLGASYLSQYIPTCPECVTNVKNYEKKRRELEELRQEIVDSVIETLLRVRPFDESPIHFVKSTILKRWSVDDFLLTAVKKNVCSSKSFILTKSKFQGTATGVIESKSNPFVRLVDYNFDRSPRKIIKADPSPSPSPSPIPIIKVQLKSFPEFEDHESLSLGSEVSIKSAEQEPFDQNNDDKVESIDSDSDYDPYGDNMMDSAPDPDPQSVKKRIQRKRKRIRKKRSYGEAKKLKLLDELYQQQNPPFFCKCGEVTSTMAKLTNHLANCTYEDQEPLPNSDQGQGDVEIVDVDAESVAVAAAADALASLSTNQCQCPLCPTTDEEIVFSTRSWLELKSHIGEKHENVVLESCVFCKREFLPTQMQHHKCSVRQEMQTINSEPVEFRCEICVDKKFKVEKYVRQHYFNIHGLNLGNTFKCDLCPRGFASDARVQEHKSQEHKNEKGIRFMCEICGKALKNPKNLRNHIKTVHENGFLFTCEVCGKQIKGKNNLKYHCATVHSDKREFPCDICGMEFKARQILKEHLLTHTPESVQRSSCPICGTDAGILYKTHKALRTHLLTEHPGTKELNDFLEAERLKDFKAKRKAVERAKKYKIPMSKILGRRPKNRITNSQNS